MASTVEPISVMAESLVNDIMSVRADEARESCNRRNGYRERRLAIGVGAITLGIPKLHAGSYFPEDLIERYSRVDRAVIADVSEMTADGVSIRRVKRLAQAMGMDRMSASQVSRICSSLGESVADLQERDLSDVAYPYIWLGATYIKCRDAGRVQSTAPVTAIGAGSGGYRRLLRLDAIDTESYDGRKSLLPPLRARGVDGVTCVTSDSQGASSARSGRPPRAPRRAPDAQRRRQRADQAEKGRRA